MKKLIGKLGAFALAGALVLVPAFAANAEEAAPVVETVQVDTTGVQTEAQVEAVAAVEVPLVAEQLIVSEKELPVEAPIASIVSDVKVPTSNSPPAETKVKVTKTVSWLTPYKGTVAPATNDPLIWDQTLYETEVCGTGWIQKDVYKYDTPDEIAIVDALIAKKTLKRVNGTPEDSKVYISHQFIQQTACVVVVDACPSDFKSPLMWEITWGYGFADRNGGTAKFNMQSNGGLTGINNGGIPSYMNSTWHWLYINKPAKNYVTTYQFADGTERSATVTAGEGGCPTIVWAEYPPVVVPASIFTDSSSDEVVCDSKAVKTTTSYFKSDPIYNAATRSYDSFGTPYLIDTKVTSRDATIAELDAAECPVVEQPEPKVVNTEWVDSKLVCDAKTVEQSRTESTTPYILVDREWVAGETTTVTAVQTRDLTSAEIAKNACPVTTGVLASTGSTFDAWPLVWLGFGGLILGALILFVGYMRRDKTAK